MKILEKRPLALILCVMLGGFSFFADFIWQTKIILAAVSLLIIGAIYLFDNLKFGRKAIVIISLVAFCVSLLLSAVWSVSFYPTEFFGENVLVSGKIIDIDNSGASTSVIVCETKEINGKRDKHRLILYVDKELSYGIRKYDTLTFRADVNEFSSSDDGFDGRSYYLSKGYSALCDDVSDIALESNKVNRIDKILSDLRLKISNTLKMRTDFETGSFLAALIVGDRTDLNGNTKLNFSRLGISHILALSGMHLAILTFAVNWILIKSGIKKKIRVSVLAFLVLFYMGLTGFSASVLRSGIMLIISGALYLLSAKADSLTSLVIAVAVIVAASPTSVYDMSLWLSAFATLGVVVFSDIVEKPDKNAGKISKIIIAFKNACMVSVFAFCATFAFVALKFDTFSVASVFTTLLFSFVIQFFIYAGLLLLIIGGILPFGKLVVLFSNIILQCAEAVSSLRFVSVSINFFIVRLLVVLLTVFFFAFLVLEIKNKKRGKAIIIILLLTVFAVAEICTLSVRYNDDVIYAPSKSGDIVLLKSDGDVTAIYSGKSFDDDCWEILDYFNNEGLTYIDNFVLVCYGYATVDFVNTLVDGIKVERIMLPKPTTDDELGRAEGLSNLLVDYGTSMKFYDLIEYIDFGEYRYRLFEKVDYVYGEYPSNVFEIITNNSRYTYVSVCEYESLSASAKALIYNSENLLIGTVGNSKYYIFDMKIPKLNKIYYYDDGRLTEDATKYYEEKGVEIGCEKSPISLID